MLSACKVELYSKLSEVDANEMLAVLMSNGVAAEKRATAETFTVLVEKDDMVRAISVLTAKGYPKATRQSIGSVFEKTGIISSPFAERVRYIYALGEEVAQTLSQIDGVVTARVHIVLPEEPSLGQAVKPSSAAVFIKHEANVDLEFLVPQIKRLVSSAIEGLNYANVTVVLTEALPRETTIPDKVAERGVTILPGLQVRDSEAGMVKGIVYGAGALVLLLLISGGAGLAIWISRRKRRASKEAGAMTQGAGSVLEPS